MIIGAHNEYRDREYGTLRRFALMRRMAANIVEVEISNSISPRRQKITVLRNFRQ